MGYEREDIGKVCRLYNNSPIKGGATYRVALHTFAIYDNITDATHGIVYAQIGPQEVVELTCFGISPKELGKDSNAICGKWYLTNRFAPENFRREGVIGRFPRMLAMGRLTGSTAGAWVSGYFWDGNSLSSVFTITRLAAGKYKATLKSGTMPSGCKVFCNGYGSDVIDARVVEVTTTSFTVALFDDLTLNDSSCDFMLMGPDWDYDMSIV